MKPDIKSTKTRTIIDFEKLGLTGLVVLGKYNYNRAETRLEEHLHPGMLEICYYDKGSQWFAVNNESYLVRGGDVFMHYPGELHGSGGYPEAKGCLYWFIFKTRHGKHAGPDHNNMAYLLRELMESGRRHFRGNIILKKILEEIFAAVKVRGDSPKIKQIKVMLLSQSLLLKLIELAGKKSNDTDNERLQKVYDLIENRLFEDITIAILAKEANLSESRFKNWFKELSGHTPLDYVQRTRVDYAVKMLRNDPSLKLKDIAYTLNFSSQQYFTTVVKKFTGKSPGELSRGASLSL